MSFLSLIKVPTVQDASILFYSYVIGWRKFYFAKWSDKRRGGDAVTSIIKESVNTPLHTEREGGGSRIFCKCVKTMLVSELIDNNCTVNSSQEPDTHTHTALRNKNH